MAQRLPRFEFHENALNSQIGEILWNFAVLIAAYKYKKIFKLPKSIPGMI